MPHNERMHKRYRLRLTNIQSKVNMVGKAEIVDISLGGVFLKTEGKLVIGKLYSILFGYRGVQYPVKGTVVRSELSGISELPHDKGKTLYCIGIKFSDESAGIISDFLGSIEQNKKEELPATANWRYRDVQFNLTTPGEKVLEFPAQFAIRDISKSGIIITTEQGMPLDSILLLELSLDAAEPVSFMGRVVSCRPSKDMGLKKYVVGVECSDLTERATTAYLQFMESLKTDAP